MKSNEFITEWDDYKKVPPNTTIVRKAVARDLMRLLKSLPVTKKYSNWQNNSLTLQFWEREVDFDTSRLTDNYIKLLKKVARQIKKINHVTQVSINTSLHNIPDITINVQ